MYHLNIAVEVNEDTAQGYIELGHQSINIAVKTLKDIEHLIYLQDVMEIIAFHVICDAWKEAVKASEE